ncbi:MBOAT family O-acyltransferase [candidate division KSB1 bacterium]
MLFNSIDFAIFLPIVFIFYWFITSRNLKLQNILILVADYIFYAWWDWRFLSLVITSSLIAFIFGKLSGQTDQKSKQKIYLIISILTNIGILVFFKYYNFFVASFVDAFKIFGVSFNPGTLKIILPIGISFYTFQALSYTIDVYYKKIKPTNDIISFFAYISFFPQLVAGPIERAINLLPQFQKARKFDLLAAKDGLRQILWGLFKKIVIADYCAVLVNEIFHNYSNLNSSTLILGAVLFAIQIYGDFSGYSDIAIGTARLFGFNLMRNFTFPYFAKNIADFWRKWHISLTTWFRDYLFLPVAYATSRKIKSEKVLKVKADIWIYLVALFVTWFVTGLWHGANWTFIIWGLLHGLLLFLYKITGKVRKRMFKALKINYKSSIIIFFEFCFTMIFVNITWIFFRATSINEAFSYLHQIFTTSILVFPEVYFRPVLAYSVVLFIVEYVQRNKEHALDFTNIRMPRILRWTIYVVIILFIFTYGGSQQQFIYFQF